MYRLRNINSSIIICTTTNFVLKFFFSVIHGGVDTNLKLLKKKIIFANSLIVKKTNQIK